MNRSITIRALAVIAAMFSAGCAWGPRPAADTDVLPMITITPDVRSGSFTDKRDGKTYRTVEIGGQTWMAENLNFKTDSSWCYDNYERNCQKYGRLYGLDAAMNACPAGWRLPGAADWRNLIRSAGGEEAAGKKLKTKAGWEYNGIRVVKGKIVRTNELLKSETGWYEYGSGTDNFGFSALPGGFRSLNGLSLNGHRDIFWLLGHGGYWWSAAETGSDSVYYSVMHYGKDHIRYTGDDISGKDSVGISVRCVKEAAL